MMSRSNKEAKASAVRKKELDDLEQKVRADRAKLEEERLRFEDEKTRAAEHDVCHKKELEENSKDAAVDEQRIKEVFRQPQEEAEAWIEPQRQAKPAKGKHQKEKQQSKAMRRAEDEHPGPSTQASRVRLV